MKCLVLLGLCVAIAYVSSEAHNCRCSVVLVGDGNILVAYDDEILATFHDCHDIQGCAKDCEAILNNGTNNGDLNFKPAGLGGEVSVGDYGCKLFGVDVHDGKGFGYSRLCHHHYVKTNFTFHGSFCCKDGKHVNNGPHCG